MCSGRLEPNVIEFGLLEYGEARCFTVHLNNTGQASPCPRLPLGVASGLRFAMKQCDGSGVRNMWDGG
jgi:hypothetical protein